MTKTDTALLIRLHQLGGSWKAASAALGLSPSTLRRWRAQRKLTADQRSAVRGARQTLSLAANKARQVVSKAITTLERLKRVLGTWAAVAAALQISESRLRSWRRGKGLPPERELARLASEVNELERERRATQKEAKEAAKGADALLKELADKSRVQRFEEVRDYAATHDEELRSSRLIRKFQNEERVHYSGEFTSGYRWTFAAEAPLTKTLESKIRTWTAAARGRLPIWLVTYQLAVFYKTSAALPPNVAQAGSGGAVVQVRGFSLELQQRFEAQRWVSSGRRSTLKAAERKAWDLVSLLKPLGRVYVRSVSVYNYRERTPQEVTDLQTAARKRRSVSLKRKRKRKKHG